MISTKVPAVDSVGVQLGNIGGEAWLAEQVTLDVGFGQVADQYRLSIEKLNLPKQSTTLSKLQLFCDKGSINDGALACEKASISFSHEGLHFKNISLAFNWEGEKSRLSFKASNIQYHGILAAVKGAWENGRWRAKIDTRPIDLRKLKQRKGLPFTVPTLIHDGKVRLSLSTEGKNDQVSNGRFSLRFDDLVFSDADERFIGEGVSGTWSGRVNPKGRGLWSSNQRIEISKGAILTPYLYVEPANKAITIDSHLLLDTTNSKIDFNRFSLNYPPYLDLAGKASLALKEFTLKQLEIDSSLFDIAPFYENLLSPVLAGPLFEKLEITGRSLFSVRWNSNHAKQVTVQLQGLNMEQGLSGGEDTKSDFALYGFNGNLHWASSGGVSTSRISWGGGELLGTIPFGPAEASFTALGAQLSLIDQVSIPLFDGSMEVEEMQFDFGSSAEHHRFKFKGLLTPISMELFSQAVGWPVMAGKLSGMIPGVNYQAGVLSVSGITLIRLFGGSILVKDLQLDGLLSPLPSLNARVDVKNIDLETLTRTFSFGKITGQLEGEVNDLRLENWQPVSFDAWFATPEDDETRHRISQKAVDNISNLGGAGVSGALSRSFLSIFKEFSYDKLGLKCKLEGNICTMGGIEDAKRGYYLVKGGGIPRIDILGFNRVTDWPQLVEKLKRITAGNAPIIE